MVPIHGFIIKDSAGLDIERGALVFDVDAAGKGILTSSSTLNFNVYHTTDGGVTVGAPATSYDYQLTSLQATKGGLPQEQDASGYYAIMADGAVMAKGTPVVKAAGGVTNLTIVPSGVSSPSNQPPAGEAVDVHARIVISNAV